MKILVLGADGMLGHVVKQYLLDKNHTVIGTTRKKDDDYYFDVIKNLNQIDVFIDQFKPEAIINCIGILNKTAEDNHCLAIMINSHFPHYLDDICTRNKIKFVHISTDCVFDGKQGSYTEKSERNATSFYGQSKALGEIDNNTNLTLRTSIIGPDINENGIGLFQWFMKQTSDVNGFDRVIWTGVTTIELAKCIEKSILNNLSGIRHVVNNDSIDKYSLLNLIKYHFKKDININKVSDYVSNKSLIRTSDFNFEVPSYDQMVKEMKDWVNKHSDLYPNYEIGNV